MDDLEKQQGTSSILLQSNPVISRAVNSWKSVSRACTLDPKFFSDAPLATARMTDR